MVREEALAPPDREAVVSAAESALDRTVAGATRFEEGLNAVYRLDVPDGDPAVLKAATFATDAELLTEAALLSRVGRETSVPVPAVLATAGPDEGGPGVACYAMRYCRGRRVTDLLELPAAARERLVVESGRHLAAVHGLHVADRFGDLRVADGELAADPGHDSWPAWFDVLAAATADGLLGEGATADPEPRFADLEPAVREALAGGRVAARDGRVRPAVLLGDYRPANLVLAPDDDPVVSAVLDVGCGPTADGLLDLALAENALVDVPLGGTARADPLRERLRAAYLAARDADPAAPLDGDRYARYRLYAWARRAGAFGYWEQFAREDDPDAAARRWRSAVEALLAALQ